MKKLIISFLFSFLAAACSAQSPTWFWAKSVPTAEVEPQVSTGKNGDTYISGNFQYDFQLGSFTFHNPYNSQAALLIKYDSSGNIVWTKSITSVNGCRYWSLATDTAGNLYAFGNFFKDSAILDNIHTIHAPDTITSVCFVVKYAPNGDILWVNTFRASALTWKILVLKDGDVICTGRLNPSSPITVSGLSAINPGGPYNSFFVRMDSSGNASVVKIIITPNAVYPNRPPNMAIDEQGNLYMAGGFSDMIVNLGNGVTLQHDNSSNSNNDVYLCKYSAAGNILWGRTWGTSGGEEAVAVKITRDKRILMAGNMDNSVSVNFGGHVAQNVNQFYEDGFLLSLDSNGNVQWAKAVNGSFRDQLWDLDLDMNNNIYIGGAFASPVLSFGNGVSVHDPQDSTYNLYLAKYTASGQPIYAKTCSTTGVVSSRATQIAVGENGVYITGNFMGNCRLGNLIVPDSGGFFLTRLKDCQAATPVISNVNNTLYCSSASTY